MTQKKQDIKPQDIDARGDSKTHYREPQRKKRTRLVIVGSILMLCIVAVITLFLLYKDLYFEYCIELGDDLPSATVFSKDGNSDIEYNTDISAIDVSVTGRHWLHISVSGKDRLVYLVIKDTVPPKAQPVELNIAINEEVTPDQLVCDLQDEDFVSIGWEEAPEFGTAGDYTVVINICDMSENTSTVTSLLHIRAVVDTMTYEAGSDLPILQSFLADESLDAAFITDLESLPLHIPGEYEIAIKVNGDSYTTSLVVTDTISPSISVEMVYISPEETVEPKDFVSSASDVTELSYEFLTKPDYSQIGFQEVDVIVTDMGGNTATETATLLISNVAPTTVEIRDVPLTAEDFTGLESYSLVELPQEVTPDELGDYDVELLLDGETNATRITVVDTKPPEAEALDVEWYLGNSVSAESFVENAFDYTEITYAFAEEPDWSMEGAQSVSVVLTDAAGNSSEYASTLTLEPDTEEPSLYGVKDRYCYIGKAVAYFAEVFAEDNCDSDVTVDVDNSNVDIKTEGTYEVIYTATDSAGNAVTKSCEFTFIEETITDEELDAVAEQVLAEITTDDMSIGEKAYAVYQYVQSRITYFGSSDVTDWKFEAYRGITEGRGDCFTFYSTSKCLLEMIGAETMCVTRYGGNWPTHHYWLLVNLGTGWYHFDAINTCYFTFERFMRTDQEMMSHGANFWSFDHSLYPATPDEPYVLE